MENERCVIDEGFNPRSPRGGATALSASYVPSIGVSIHAPHEGERLVQPMYDKAAAIVSIHAPHEGERRKSMTKSYKRKRFQSTLPTRGSDTTARLAKQRSASFNPRSPRGGATKSVRIAAARYKGFNPRSPRGGATTTPTILRRKCAFQSTLPTRGSDIMARLYVDGIDVSIHAPHEGERRGQGAAMPP